MKLLKFLLFLLIALVVTTNVFAADNSKKKEQKLNLSKLSLELKASKTEFLLLEPISLTIKLKNNFGEPIADSAKPKVSSEDVVINCSFTDEENEDKKLKLPELTESLASVISAEEITESEKLWQYHLVSGRTDLFSKAGEYKFQLTIHSAKQRLTSNLLTISIIEPNGSDKEILDKLKTLPAFTDLMSISGISEDKELFESVEKLPREFPNSSYINYVIFNLAEIHFSLGNTQKAISNLSYLVETDKFPFANQALGFLKEIYLANQDETMVNYYEEKLEQLDTKNSLTIYF